MELGTFNRLTVLRETDISYLLTDGENEVFLHKKEAEREYHDGERLTVFVYTDNLGRPTASTKTPMVTTTTAAFLEVVSINHEYGVFLEYGILKDLLLSKDDLPLSVSAWPVVGDKLFVTIKIRKELLFAKQVARKSVADFLHPSDALEPDQSYDAIVSFFLVEGLVCFTEAGHEIFVHYNNTRKKYRLGETVSIRILKINEDQEAVGTLIQQKELMLKPDADILLEYLDNHGGMMRFTDASAPEEIQAAFHMSKGAFKRALGTLYREGRVDLRPDSTHIIEKKS
ncbi:MAG: S1-like domain-containing RNA-binding protein [bacterium]